MRLLKLSSSGEVSITADLLENIPPYAILSHTWQEDDDEVTFNDLREGAAKGKPGYAKILFCGEQARADGLDHFWIDTCCIDKASHTELSEALNSMFRWYKDSVRCYVYLSDVTTHKRDRDGQSIATWIPSFRSSRWFTRGWTLQELLAPQAVDFFSREREWLGDKKSLSAMIQEITEIPAAALQGDSLSSFDVKERLAWRAKRNTKRTEDQVYCLLGIFNVHMAPLYGEGSNCWSRFKDELSKSFRDQLNEIGEESSTTRTRSTVDPAEKVRNQMLNSLDFSEMDSRRSTIKRAHSTTCAWFLEHPSYLAWLDPNKLSEHQGFLWIHGKPGAGKSTLMKFVHAHAVRAKTKNEIVISFFFNARGHDIEKSTVGMYRSILFQLLTKAPDLHAVLDVFQMAFREQSHSFTWTVEMLQVLISSAVAKLGNRRLKCFVDALDECNEKEIREMIVFWEDLGQDALNNGIEVYTCFSSRHYPTIDIRNGRQVTLENESGHGADLATYVHSHFRAGNGTYVDEVRSDICEKANGVFMWAVLVVDILNKEFSTGRIFAVKKRLREIPAKLSELFSDILRRDRTNMDDLLLCLQWILFARRPLSREEFYFAMVSGLDPEADNLEKWDPDHVTIEHMDRFLLNSSKGLAELTKTKTSTKNKSSGKVKNSTVQFIHESVRDFLLKENGLSELWPQLGPDLHGHSHEQLRKCCLNYFRTNASRCFPLDEPIPKASSEKGKALRDSLQNDYPFLDYAHTQILYHADQAAEKIPQGAFLADFHRLDLASYIRVSNMFARYDIRRHTEQATLPYIFAENSLVRLINTAYRSGWQLDARGERYGHPLCAAIVCGDVETVRALASQEAREDVEALVDFKRSMKNRGAQPLLLYAISEGPESVCELLLASKAFDIRCRDPLENTTLTRSATRGFEQVTRLLLAESTDMINDKNFHEHTPVSFAAQCGHFSILQMLVEHGANVNIADSQNRTPLSYAAGRGDFASVQLLLTRGADLRVRDKNGRTALSHAAQFGGGGVEQLLLENGAYVDSADMDRRTALSYATEEGRVEILQLFLAKHAMVRSRDANGWEALHHASHHAQFGAVKLLLAHGASVHAETKLRQTALHCYMQTTLPLHSLPLPGTEFDIIRLLLAHGARPNAASLDGSSAVSIAAAREWQAALDVLQRYGNRGKLSGSSIADAPAHAISRAA